MTEAERIAQRESTDFNMESGFNGMDTDANLINAILNDDSFLDIDEMESDDFNDELEAYDFMD